MSRVFRRDPWRRFDQALAWFQPTAPACSGPSGCPSSTSRGRRALLRLPRARDPGFQARPLRPLRRGRRPGRNLARADARGRGAATRVRRALLPRGRRADGRAQDLPVRAVTRTSTSSSIVIRTPRPPWSVPASPGTATSSAPSSARSSPTSLSTARRATTSSSFGSTGSDPRRKVRRVSGSDLGDAGERTRTSKSPTAQRVLSPSRLPVPPRPRGLSVGARLPRH